MRLPAILATIFARLSTHFCNLTSSLSLDLNSRDTARTTDSRVREPKGPEAASAPWVPPAAARFFGDGDHDRAAERPRRPVGPVPVMKEYEATERETPRDADRVAATEISASREEDDDEQEEATTEQLRASKRGTAVSLAANSERLGLSALKAALGGPIDTSAVIANTFITYVQFEWGLASLKQHVQGAVSFRGAPWYSFIWYRSTTGNTSWGLVNVVLRAVGGVDRPCVVV